MTISQVERADHDDSLAAGDVRIVASNGGVDLALIGDSISTGLSPAAIEKVHQETDTSKVTGTGFGCVDREDGEGTVQGAIGTRVSFPVAAVREARYDGEKIVFEWSRRAAQDLRPHEDRREAAARVVRCRRTRTGSSTR